jgi:ribosomal protein L11 methyltransferase
VTEAPSSAQWLELLVQCDAEAVEPVAELFASHGFNQGVAIEEPFTQDGDGDNFQVDPAGLVSIRTYLPAVDTRPEVLESIRRALWHLGQIRTVGNLQITSIAEEDWANAWKAHYSVHKVGNRVLVRAPWHEYQPSSSEVVIELDPGMAFGTGLHPSTQLSMMAIERELRPGASVLDVGIGSGILATGAALLGAGRVDGVDIEPVAVRSARENAARNHVDHKVRVEEGSVGEGQPFQGKYDLVVANIIARVLVDLSDALISAVRPGGSLILAGIIDTKEQAVLEAFKSPDLHLTHRNTMEDWISLTYHRSF